MVAQAGAHGPDAKMTPLALQAPHQEADHARSTIEAVQALDNGRILLKKLASWHRRRVALAAAGLGGIGRRDAGFDQGPQTLQSSAPSRAATGPGAQ